MHYKNLFLIGSSHVSKESVKKVEETIEKVKPGIVAVELDRDRLEVLLSKDKHKNKIMPISKIGLNGWLFGMIGAWMEKKIGQIVKVEPGTEMKTAVLLAKKHNAKIALIDQHISVTLRKFSQRITWKEKFRFLGDVIVGIFAPKKQMKDFNLSIKDLNEVPNQKTINSMMAVVKKRYPNFYDVLVSERNVIMANNIAAIMKQFPDEKIVAVVGAGHEKELLKLVKEKLYKHSGA